MTGTEYQRAAMRTNDGKSTDRLWRKMEANDVPFPDYELGGVLNASLGLSGEVGELNDMIKKWIFHEKEIDMEHLKKEASDICWYIALLCESFGWSLDEVFQINIDKLLARYQNGFNVKDANNRKEGDI